MPTLALNGAVARSGESERFYGYVTADTVLAFCPPRSQGCSLYGSAILAAYYTLCCTTSIICICLNNHIYIPINKVFRPNKIQVADIRTPRLCGDVESE